MSTLSTTEKKARIRLQLARAEGVAELLLAACKGGANVHISVAATNLNREINPIRDSLAALAAEVTYDDDLRERLARLEGVYCALNP